MANGKIQIRDGAGNNLFPKVRTIDMTDSAGNVKLFDGEKIRPQFIPNAVDDIVPYAAVTSSAGVATVSQQADYHYINVTSKKIYATTHNGTSFVWDSGSALNTTTLYTSNGKSFRWDGTNLVEIVQPKAIAGEINATTNNDNFVPTVAAVTAYAQPKGNYAAAGHNHNGTYVSKIIAGKNITLSPTTGVGGEITISATDTNTNLVSSVKGANGLTQNASTGNVIISGIDTKGDSSTKGVVITTSVITSNAGGNTSVVPTMNAIYTALAGKADNDHITIVSKGTNTTVTSSVNGNTTTYWVSATNTNLVSSVTGYNGLSANPTTGVVKVSGVDTKGDGSTRGVVITSNAIVSTVSTNAATGSQAALETSVVVPTMRAVYNALAGKANNNHTHNYASQDHVTIVSKGDNTTVTSSVNGLTTTYYVSGTPDHIAIVTSGNTGIAVTSAVNGNTTTYYVSNKITNTDHITSVVAGTNTTVTSSINGSTVTYTVSATNTNLVSSVKGANGLTQNASTGNVIISGIDTKGDGTTKGVVITSNGITSNAAGNTSLVPTMNAVYTALAGKADNDHITSVVSGNAGIKVTSTIAGNTVTYQVSNTVTNTNLVSSVTGYNGLSANPTTGVVKVSGVSTTGDGATIGVVITSDAIVSTASTNAATGSKNVGETKYIVPTMRAVWNMSNNINSRFANAGVAVDGYFFSGLADCPAMRSKYRTTTWSDSAGGSGVYPGWLAPIKADGLTEVMNTFSLGRGYTISGAGGSSAFSIPQLGQFLSGCAVPTYMTFATAVSELSSSVSGKANSDHTHNYATADHITIVSKGTNTTVTSSVNGNTTTYWVSATNTNLVSSVKGANGLTQNASTGNVIISGVDTTGNGTTKGVVITSNGITSNAAGNTSLVPTMNAVYTALAGKQPAGNYVTSNTSYTAAQLSSNHSHATADLFDVMTGTDDEKHVTPYAIAKGGFVRQFTAISSFATSAAMSSGLAGNYADHIVYASCVANSAFNGFYRKTDPCTVENQSVCWFNRGDGKFYRVGDHKLEVVSGYATSNTSYTTAELGTNHTHNYATTDHVTIVSKGTNTTVTSSVNGNTTTYWVSATNTSYTAANLSTNHSHAIDKIVGLQAALNDKATANHTHSGYIPNQAAYAVDGYFFSGLSECSAMRSKYESTLWTNSGGSGTYPGWVAPITATGVTEITNLFNYCKGYASNVSVNANVQSFFSACAVPTFMGFAHAIVELNNSLAGKQATIPANTYAPYTHAHTGYVTSNTSYTAAQLSTNHSHAVATSVAIQTGANNTQYATPQALAKGGFVRQFTDSANKTAAQMSADWANHESHHILFYNVTDAPAKNGFYMGKTGSKCTIEDQSAAWFCREKKNFYWLYQSNGNQYLSAFLPNADIVPTIIENHYSEITNNYITSMTTNFNNFTTINNNTFINIKFVKQYMMINNGIMIVT